MYRTLYCILRLRQPGQNSGLLFTAINDIDASALESLEAIDARLKDAGVLLHLSEVKGPVMDRLRTTELLQHLRGQIFISQFQAVQALTPEVVQPPAHKASLQP
jgi:SulP family sulfate permease